VVELEARATQQKAEASGMVTLKGWRIHTAKASPHSLTTVHFMRSVVTVKKAPGTISILTAASNTSTSRFHQQGKRYGKQYEPRAHAADAASGSQYHQQQQQTETLVVDCGKYWRDQV